MYYYTQYLSPVGWVIPVCNETGLIGVWIEGQKHYGQAVINEAIKNDSFPLLLKTKHWLEQYFAGEKPDISELPLEPRGSEFQQRVWKLLCEIPYGETTTYGQLAKKVAAQMGKERMSAQAIGGAVGRNPISIIIPCHRVIGTDGSMTGYDGGVEKKLKLLEVERLTK